MIYILRIECKEDLEKIKNPDIKQYIKEEMEGLCEEEEFEWELDNLTFYGIDKLFLVERENEFPLHLPFEYCNCKHFGDTVFYTAGYLKTNEDIIEYIIPEEIINDKLREFLETEI